MVIIALLVSASLPYFRNMQLEAQKTRVKTHLDTIMKGVEAYAAAPRNSGRCKYPDGTDQGNQQNWTGSRAAGTGWQTDHLTVTYSPANLLGTTGPIVSSQELLDPFSPAGTNLEYGYYVNTQGYYIIWSNGLNRVNINCTVSLAGVINAPGSAVYASNGH
jgi:hypothetical protein